MAKRSCAHAIFARAATVIAAAASAAISISALQAGPASAAASAQPIGGTIGALSCTGAGTCAAAGVLDYPNGSEGPLVASQNNGTWGKAATIPGLSALPGGEQFAVLTQVSCSSKGNCGAGGLYQQKGDQETAPAQGFVVTEKHGVWGKAKAVAGLAALNVGGRASVKLISCRSTGNCTAAGVYAPVVEGEDDSTTDAFVVSEKNGTWGKAEQVPGLVALDNGISSAKALSCVTPGNCTLTGGYDAGTAPHHVAAPFVATQTNGIWGTATTFPGIEKAGTNFASIDTLFCRSSGDCVGTGTYNSSDNVVHVFAINETSGTWGAAKVIPGFATLPGGGASVVTDAYLTCPSAGDCSLGGNYGGKSGGLQDFVVAERGGKWGPAQALPGTVALNTGNVAVLAGLACPAPGDCVAAGGYVVQTKHHIIPVAFVTAEKNGKWGKPEVLPGSAALSADVIPQVLACNGVGNCSLAGLYSNKHNEPLVATEKNGVWGKAGTLPGVKIS